MFIILFILVNIVIIVVILVYNLVSIVIIVHMTPTEPIFLKIQNCHIVRAPFFFFSTWALFSYGLFSVNRICRQTESSFFGQSTEIWSTKKEPKR